MKTTNTSLIKTVAASAAAMFATAAFAGETVRIDNPAPPTTGGFYSAGELQLGVSGLFVARAGENTPAARGLGLGPALRVRNRDRGDEQLWGADVDVAYFLTRNIGVGIEQQWIDAGRPLWNSALNAILRAPLSEDSPWAPYLFGGGGIVYAAGHGRLEGHLGAGIEYRFTPKIGTFIDGRYTWVDSERIPQYGAFRAGLRFVF